MNDHRKLGLDPVVDDHCRIVILGSLPGDDSLRLGQYYAHKDNKFWTILGQVFEVDLRGDYASRIEFLLSRKIALWDVLKCADRRGSIDINIKNEIENDFNAFFLSYPRIQTIAFNGSKAQNAFEQRVRGRLHPAILSSMQLIRLPSSSPTPGRYVRSLDEKVLTWKIIRDLVMVSSESSRGQYR